MRLRWGREKVCDICGKPFWKGRKLNGIRQKKLYMCDTCEQTFKLLIIGKRKTPKKPEI